MAGATRHALLLALLAAASGAARVPRAHARVSATRAPRAAPRARASAWLERTTIAFPAAGAPHGCAPFARPAAAAAEAPAAGLPWLALPGLFAGGELDVMTRFLLERIGAPPARARVLDFGCGSGAIGGALLRRAEGVRVTLLDADAFALAAARRNVPGAEAALCCDRFKGPRQEALRRGGFDWLVSNPPVHARNGIEQDFRVLRALVRAAPRLLRARRAGRVEDAGVLWVVAQQYVPVGPLLRAHGEFERIDACFSDDGRFALWRATVGR